MSAGVYLKSFRLPNRGEEECFLGQIKRTCYPDRYPFNVFRYREMPVFTFEPVAIFCGGNGSGKSTILNVLGEKLKLKRGTNGNRSTFFEDYVRLCRCELSPGCAGAPPAGSRVITSDDVFDYLLNLRCLNEGIDNKREELLKEYTDYRYSDYRLQSLDDYEELRKHVEAVRYSGSGYVKRNLMDNVPQHSNGESALRFFAETIDENALYLLDEPENSLSAQKQLELRDMLHNSARFYGCQFVIATHSPFLLSMPHAAIYDLDAEVPCRRKWTELESVRSYRDFFMAHEEEFQ